MLREKPMIQQDIKSWIRNWVNRHRKIESDLGDIVIGNLLGEGGNAIVFDTPFAGGAAIKFLAELVSAPHSKRYARFLDEYRNLIKLVSTGAIVPIYQFGIQNMDGAHVPYILMERCIKTLNDLFQSNRLVNVNEFENLLERMLQILEIIHKAKIVHRDIKPQNILLRSNDTWVLGDFGIAWFDPEMYKKIAQTDRNERLANWGFSAPEQVRRNAYNQPTSSMDLYALGQTLYYCVTGHVVSGTEHPRFIQIAPSLAQYDSLIDKLVRQEPSDRLQTVQDVRLFIAEQQGNRKLDNGIREDTKRMHRFKREQEVFDEALRSAMPGAYRYKQAKSQVEIDRVLSSLAKRCEACNLWWFAGFVANSACPIEKLTDDIWLIEHQECRITDLWIRRHSTLERQYILIHLAARPPFSVYHSEDTKGKPEEIGPHATYEGFDGISEEINFGESLSGEITMQEAGYHQGSYITRGEYDDGYALINGAVVELNGTQLRIRNLEDDFLFLAPQFSVYNDQRNDQRFRSVYHTLRLANKIDFPLLKPLESMERPEWMGVWD